VDQTINLASATVKCRCNHCDYYRQRRIGGDEYMNITAFGFLVHFWALKLNASDGYFRSYAARRHLHTRQQLTVTRTPISYLYCGCFKVQPVRALLLRGAGSALLRPQRISSTWTKPNSIKD